jgi:dihydrodipicolinate reductase
MYHIIEKHHKNKQDAPSGTSSDLASSLFDVTSSKLDNHDGENNIINGINIYSERGESFLLNRLLISNQNMKLFH